MKINNLKITVVGSGYVGMSISVLLSQKNLVTVFDIDESRVKKINNRQSTVRDELIDEYLLNKELNLTATNNQDAAYKDADFVIMALPTDFNEKENSFDTSILDQEIKSVLEKNNKCFIIIKSTIPIGHTNNLRNTFNTNRILYSPEFLREGNALADNLEPSRIIVGDYTEEAQIFGKLLKSASENNSNLIFMNSSEAESVKLFSNSYLAMRVAFFNELDSFALSKNLQTKNIIDGMSLDNRIGFDYNNPSFGYGGYCLPKDTKQLLSNFNNVPQSLIKSIVESNKKRKDFIADKIINSGKNTIGFYRLIMKSGSDNFRSAAIQGIIKRIKNSEIKMYIYEPLLNDEKFENISVIKDLEEFKSRSELIITNRITEDLKDVSEKIFSRDIFLNN
jgi:UDPglucose 6-dehydrogenase